MLWRIEKKKLSELRANPINPRRLNKAQAEHLKSSISKFGQCEPIVINTDNTIIGGHQRVKTLRSLGKKEVDVYIPDETLSEYDAAELTIRLNKNVGEWDVDVLANSWEPRDLIDWGFTESELEFDINVIEGNEPSDEAPPLPKEAQTKKGDLYQLGEHLLLCGDCRCATDVAKLLGDRSVDLLLTDPPYGVDYAKKTESLKSLRRCKHTHQDIASDIGEDYPLFFSEFLSLIPWSSSNAAYICMSGQELHSLRQATENCGMKWGDYLVWVKNQFVLGRKDYKPKHEFVYYGWKGKHKFFGPNNRSTILEFDKPHSSENHPTMKPIPLFRQLMEDGSKKGALVYDPFCGSGTSLLACSMEPARICRAMELSPSYCDVIINRWVDFRNQKGEGAEIIRNGKKVKWREDAQKDAA